MRSHRKEPGRFHRRLLALLLVIAVSPELACYEDPWECPALVPGGDCISARGTARVTVLRSHLPLLPGEQAEGSFYASHGGGEYTSLSIDALDRLFFPSAHCGYFRIQGQLVLDGSEMLFECGGSGVKQLLLRFVEEPGPEGYVLGVSGRFVGYYFTETEYYEVELFDFREEVGCWNPD